MGTFADDPVVDAPAFAPGKPAFGADDPVITPTGAGESAARALAGSGGAILDALSGLNDMMSGGEVARALGQPSELHDLARSALDFANPPNAVPATEGARIARDVTGLPGAALEGAENLGSMLFSLPAAGAAGLGTLLGNGLGLTDAAPSDVVNKTADTLTHHAETPTGKRLEEGIAAPFDALAKGGYRAGEYVQDATGSPALATGVDTIIQALPMLLGRGKGGAEIPRDAITPEAVDAHLQANPPPRPIAPGAAEAPRAAAPDIQDAEFTDLANLMLPDQSRQLALPAPDTAAAPRELAPPTIDVDRSGNARTSADFMQQLIDTARSGAERQSLGLTPDTERAIAAHAARNEEPIAEQRSDDAPPWWLEGQRQSDLAEGLAAQIEGRSPPTPEAASAVVDVARAIAEHKNGPKANTLPERVEKTPISGQVQPPPESVPPPVAPQAEGGRAAAPRVVDFETFASEHGANRQDYGDAGMHRSSKNVSDAAKRRALARQLDRDTEHLARRDDARAEYDAAIARGDIREPTRIESLIKKAQGHPENASVQAARRILEKQGIPYDDEPKPGTIAPESGTPIEPAASTNLERASEVDTSARRWRQTNQRDSKGRPKLEPVLDYSRDGLVQWIGKNGGINFDQLASQTGTDRALLKDADVMRPFGRVGFAALRREGGMSLETLRERMQQDGWLPRDDAGTPQQSLTDAADLAHEALNGRQVFHPYEGADARLERQFDEQNEREMGLHGVHDVEAANADELSAQHAERAQAARTAIGRDLSPAEESDALSLGDLYNHALAVGADPAAVRSAHGTTPAETARNLYDLIRQQEGERAQTRGNEEAARRGGVGQAETDRAPVESGEARRAPAEEGGAGFALESVAPNRSQGELFANAAQAPAERAAPKQVPTSADMFGGATARDHVDAAERERDARRNGMRGGREDTGDGGLFDGERPEQTRVPSRDSAHVEELSDADLTPAERAAFNRQRTHGEDAEMTRYNAEQSRTEGAATAERTGMRAAVDDVLAGAEGAPKVEFARDEDGLPEGTKLPSYGGKKVRREGTYDPNTGRVHIFTDTVTTPERAAWVAAHEIAGHHGLRGLIGERAKVAGRPAREVLDSTLETARKNPTIDRLSEAIGKSRNAGPAQRHTMTEEALAELAAATRTGNFEHIADRYGVEVPEAVRSGIKSAIGRFVERIKALLAQLFKKARFSDADVHKIVEDMWQHVRKPRERAGAPEETARESVGPEESLESVAADDMPRPKREAEAPSRRPGESQRDYARRVMRTSKESIREATKIAKHQQKVGRANFRAMLGQQARAMDVADAAFAEARKTFDQTPRDINLATIDEWENGRPIKDRDAAQFFDDMKAAFDQRVARIQELDPSALQSLIENYFPHIWEDSSKASKWYQGFTAKRPLEGNKSFLKQRTWGTIKEGMASGLKPVSTNPVDLALLKLQQMDKFIAFHEFRDDLKSRGWLKEMAAGERVPEGYAKIEDPAFAKAGGLQGYYAVPELVAKDVNNYLSPSLYRFGAWKSLRAVQNMLMSARLGWSMFHAGFTSLDNLIMHVDVGARRLMDGDIGGGLSTILQAPLSLGVSPFEGGQLNKAWRGLRETDPHTSAILHMLEQGGARFKMSMTDYNQGLQKIKRSIRQAIANKDLPSAGELAKHVLPAIGEMGSWFIHHWLVPNQKMSARVMLAKFELDRFAKALDKKRGDYAGIIDAMHPDVVKQLASKIVDVVDDRLGQMTYDNQFWHKMAREVAQAAIGAVGWQVGTLRTVTGGIADLPQMFKPEELVAPLDKAGKITDKDMGRVSGRLTYLLTLGLVMGGLGAVTQYLLTGKGPSEIKDYFFPKTGRRNPDDSEERLQYPSYWMDHYKLATHPLETAKHKLHPSIGMLTEALANQDYYGVQIRNPKAPWQTQAKEIAEYVAKGFEPYSINNQSKMVETDSGAGQRVANFFGVTQAPRSVSKSDFQAFVAEKKREKIPAGARTQESAEHTQALYAVEDAIRDLYRDHPDFAKKSQDEQAKLLAGIDGYSALNAGDKKKAAKAAERLVPEIQFRGLTIADRLEAYDLATSDERKRYNLAKDIVSFGFDRSTVFQGLDAAKRAAILKRVAAIAKENGIEFDRDTGEN